MKKRALVAFVLSMLLWASAAFAQQTGSISGKVTMPDGSPVPGVTVEASADVLPAARVAVTDENGEYQLPALPPGNYTVKFSLSGMQDVTRTAAVQLAATTGVNAQMSVQGVTEQVTVTAGATLVDRTAPTLKSGITSDQFRAIPTGQDYRDLMKLIPGVQVTQDAFRGPSAGGSGQDNVYQFDGVNVTLPLFGTMSAEPASHDIEQVTTVRGGARAIDFDRSGGFTIDSVSKSGTNRFSGLAQYQFQNSGMSANLDTGGVSRFEQDRYWLNAYVGGPVIEDRLFFFASYYRPSRKRELRSNFYGDLPDYESIRNEGFGKLTFAPLTNVLANASYRDSKREETSDLFADATAGTAGSGSESRQRIYTADASWVINSRSHLSGKFTRFELETLGRPDNISSAVVNTTIGTTIDVNALDTLGRLQVPVFHPTNAAVNAFLEPVINRYGYVKDGVRTGGGIVGFGSQFDDNDFYRTEGKIAYNITLGGDFRHDIHVGYQWYRDEEDLLRSSNGWGLFTVPGGAISTGGTPVFYRAAFQQQGIGAVPVIHSEYVSQNIEINDAMRWGNFTFNLGVIASHDTLYGQGLKENSSKLSGFDVSPGTKYEMYDLPFSKMIQPRASVTWAFNGRDTVFASYARYNPAASSLPRAASWDRNLAVTLNADFDATGRLFAVQPVRSSSGKLFQEDLDPRQIDEYMVGSSFQVNDALSMRVYGRYREGSNFWEDVNNGARLFADAPADLREKGLHIPNLDELRRDIGNGVLSGSSYVIAELDGAYTKYQELTVESDWRRDRLFVRGSYTFSKYYGNFDQDNTTAVNDANVFIGSSFLADGPGRQLWNFRDGRLRGDRPHLLKVFGYYELPWNATAGAYFVAQSGQPWEKWDRNLYIPIGGDANNDSSLYAEPAGSRRSDAHNQLDVNYTQSFMLNRFRIQVVGDLYNVFDNQTGYNIQPAVNVSGFGEPRHFFDPQRFQLSVRFIF